ncbi:hypothetical protein P7C73_g4285, partial [Tremellales sp. Uapishka_1]
MAGSSSRRLSLRRFYSILYHTSFYFFILLTAVLIIGSAWGLGEQAFRSAGQRRWNIVALVGGYVALARHLVTV